MRNIINIWIGLLILASCSKENKNTATGSIEQDSITVAFSDSTILSEPLPSDIAAMDLFGRIGLAGVDILSSNQKAKSDNDGAFFLNKVEVVNGRSVIHLQKDGYFPLTRAQEKDQILFDAKLQPMGNGENTVHLSFDANNGQTINIQGMKVEISALSLVDQKGEIYKGKVQTDIFYLSPNNPDFIRLMPGGDMMAIDRNKEMVKLFSYGMVDVLLKDTLGLPLQLAKGKTSQLTFPLPQGMDGSLESIPLWYFNEKNGLWEEQGIAYKEGDQYVGQVGHFSWWNCDVLWNFRNNGKIQINLIHPCTGAGERVHRCNYMVVMNDQYYLYNYVVEGATIYFSYIPSEIVNIKVYNGQNAEPLHDRDYPCHFGNANCVTEIAIDLLNDKEFEIFKYKIIDDSPISHWYNVSIQDKNGVNTAYCLRSTMKEDSIYIGKSSRNLILKYADKTYTYKLPRKIDKGQIYTIDLRTYKEDKKNKIDKNAETVSEEEYYSQFFKSNRIEITLNENTDSIIPLPKDIHVHCNPRITEYYPSLQFTDQFNVLEPIYLTGSSKKIYLLEFSNYNENNNTAACVIVEKDKMGNVLRKSQMASKVDIRKLKDGYGLIIHGGYYNLLCSRRDKEQPEPFYAITQDTSQCVDYRSYTPEMIKSEFGSINNMYRKVYESRIYIKIPNYSDEIVNFIDDYKQFESGIINIPNFFGYYSDREDGFHPKLDYVNRKVTMSFSKKQNLDAYFPIVALELVTYMKKLGFHLFDQNTKGVFEHSETNALVTIYSDVSTVDVKIDFPIMKKDEKDESPTPPVS